MSPTEVTATSGTSGRLSAPPPGGVYVRDPAAARAHALQERAKAFTDAGEEVPEELAAMLAEFVIDVADEEINLVDRVTGELLAEVEQDAGEELPEGAHRSWEVPAEGEAEPEPEPEPEAEPEPEPEPELEPEPEPVPEPEVEEVDVESLTVAELRAELDALGVEHSHEDRKADLQQKLRDALEG